MRRIVLVLLLIMASSGWAQEPFRPRFHFTPQKNWMNDPNGLIYHQGEYHLFYQHNPFGTRWGHMSWGHAVSEDLIHWEHLPVALPEKEDLMAFSGSVVAEGDRLVAIYTGYRPSDGRQAQYLAFSDDNGRTWRGYEGNPVLDIGSTDFRDPKVFRYGDEWRMVVALPTERKVSFYSSEDLRSWTWLSDFGPQGAVGGAWECPDLYELPFGDQTRWVLQVDLDRNARAGGSGGQYFVGRFDGTRFTLDEPEVRPLTVGGRLVWEGARSESGESWSEPFLLDDGWLNFRLRGGRHPGEVGVALVVDGDVVAESTGYNGSVFQWVSWDVSRWRGRTARLRVWDQTEKLWGWLEARDFRVADRPAPDSVERARWVDYGPDFYACVSFNNVPDRRVWLAWMNNWLYAEEIPTSPWRSAMTIPRSVFLQRQGDGVVLCQEPVEELASLRRDERVFESLPPEVELGDAGEFVIRVERGEASRLNMEVLGLKYRVDFEERTLEFVREQDFHPDFPASTVVPLRMEGDAFSARVLFDRSCVELFTEGGAVSLTARTFPTEMEPCSFSVEGTPGAVTLRAWQLATGR